MSESENSIHRHLFEHPPSDQHVAWGWNKEGQLGTSIHSRQEAETSPQTISKVFFTRDLSVGLSHTLFISRNGEVYATGKGRYGRLGLSDERTQTVPVRLSFSKRVLRVSAGSFHSAFVTERLELYTFGRGESGQLGHGELVDVLTPRLVEGLTDPVDLVSCGADHTILTTLKGCVYGMGANKHHQVNEMDVAILPTPVFVDLNPLVDSLTARASDITGLSAGTGFNVAIKKGVLYAWGLNAAGQCGASSKDETIARPHKIKVPSAKGNTKRIFTQVATGMSHAVAVTEEGEVFGWGSSQHGQLGLGMMTDVVTVDTSKPVRIGESLLAEYVIKVACGAFHTLVLTSTGYLYSWGLNDYGQTGPEGVGGITSVPHRMRIPQRGKDGSTIMSIAAGGRSSMATRYYPTLVKVRESTYDKDIHSIYLNNQHTDCKVVLRAKEGGDEDKHVNAHKIIMARHSQFVEQLAGDTIDATESFTSIPDLSSFLGRLYSNNVAYSLAKVQDQAIHAHKCILVSRSNKLKVELESQFQEALNKTLYIDNVDPSVYLTFLHYLYTDKLHIDQENAMNLLELAHEQDMERMLELVQEYIINVVDEDSVSFIYETSMRLGLETLSDYSEYYISKNMDAVAQTDTFNALPDDLKKKLSLHLVQEGKKAKGKQQNCIIN
ncbi:hypothetical protein SAMD00019534_119550 [Acytostelium subglobosum LB1]|uniref:hypothetical protein n=1 Tax=Acytostelium subglobosum LB1 TaxID=1410327 RepID=UPI000644C904|nr:hypothetical protein SAMD00019534_119550 [Acytostelium subglobosum LB1]GAM28779.1 hypothetical protein SAMD00019534_119550 [Acytostelium subglobosum LB1]|eukprot:XP_012748334.1 hypothetical protein SAMD00019534_119550 [Acytostelium subglobosum LB1]